MIGEVKASKKMAGTWKSKGLDKTWKCGFDDQKSLSLGGLRRIKVLESLVVFNSIHLHFFQ